MKKSFELQKGLRAEKFIKILAILGIGFALYLGYEVYTMGKDIGSMKFFPFVLFAGAIYVLVSYSSRLKTEKKKHNELVNFRKEKTREQMNDYLLEKAAKGEDEERLQALAQHAEKLIRENDLDKV